MRSSPDDYHLGYICLFAMNAPSVGFTFRGMRRKSRRFTAFLAAGLIAVSATGCLSSSASVASDVEKPDLTVAVVPAVDSAGFFIALYEGIFKQHGLNVKFVPAVSSETVIESQVKGQIDISGGNYVSYLQAQRAGTANLEIFAEGSVMLPGTQALYVMPKSKITTLQDLAGRTVGINAPQNILYLLAASTLADHGIPVSEVHFRSDIALPQMAAALHSGAVSAAVLPEPFGGEAEAQYGVVQLADLDQGATTSFPVQGYVVTRQWAQRYPRTLAAFNAALQQGQTIADTNRHAVETAMEDLPSPLAVSPVIAAMMALDSYPVGAVNAVRIQRVANVMNQFISFPSFRVKSMIGNP